MKIIKLMRGLYKYIILMIIFSIVQVFCELYLPNIMSNIVDVGVSLGDKSYIINKCFIMVLITLIGLISSILVVYSTAKFSNKYGYNIRKSLYAKINSLSKTEIDEYGASTLITRSTNNISNITSTFSFGLRLMIFAPVMGIGASIVGYKTAPELAPVVIVSVIFLLIALLIIFTSVFPKFEKAQKLLDELNSKSREILSGLRIVKAFSKKNFFKSRFDKVNKDNMNLNIFLNKVLFLVQPLMILTINVGTVIIVYLSTNYLSNNTLEIGAMMAFIQYESIILMSFLMLLVIILNIPRVIVSFKRINEIFETKPCVDDTGKLQITNLESIEFSHVYFKYPDAKEYMLKDINFRVESKEKIGIIGSSGSGKTTIINLLLRHIEPSKGEILINGINIREYDLSSLRNIYSYAPQKSLLFKGTIKENLSFEKEYSSKDLQDVLEIACIDDFVASNYNGYDYKIEQSATNLSGGQKQRLVIARALLNKGKILIFDDSFSAVDYITDKKIRKGLKSKFGDAIQLIVTQRVSTIEDADKILVIDEGKIENIGNYEELSKNSTIFKEFIASQRKEVIK